MFLPMQDLPPFLRFAPVAVRRQHNGWSPALQLRFIVALARGAGPDGAARSLGRTRQSVYQLRKRPGAESFAAAWDRALDFARRGACAGRTRVPGGGIETVLVPRYYRGRLVGFVQREDTAGAMRILGRLDRLADRVEQVRHEASAPAGIDRIDEIHRANGETSSIPKRCLSPLDGRRAGSPPCARTRKESP